MNKLTDLQRSQVASLVRMALILCGGWLAKKGIEVDVVTWTDNLIAAAGGAQILFALIWSFKQKSDVAPAVALQKEVNEGTAIITKADVAAQGTERGKDL